MSYSKNLEALEVWKRLKDMEPEKAREKALDDGSEMNEVWATAQISGMVLTSLGMAKIDDSKGDPDDNPDLVLWVKLAGRPLAKVYAHYLKQKHAKPEQRMHLLSQFAKSVPPLPQVNYPGLR